MSRYDGWLVRYLLMQDTPAKMTLRDAAKGAGVRIETFSKALTDPALLRDDCRCLGINPDEWRVISSHFKAIDAEEDVLESMLVSGRSFKRRFPSSDKYRGSGTKLGFYSPRMSGWQGPTDELGCPINSNHPEPDGEWNDDLDRAIETPTRSMDWAKRARESRT